MADRRAQARRRGGANRSNAARVRKLLAADIRPIFDLIVDATRQTYAGTLDPRVLTALAAGAAAVCRLYETGRLEDRLNAIGAQLDVGDQQTRHAS